MPIRVDAAIEGLIHAVDHRENYFPLRLVEALEDVSQRLGLAMQRFHLEHKLRESVISLNVLSSHLLSVQEEEQRRIALELHDGCGQDLNVLKLRLKIIRDHCPAERSDLTHDCNELLAYADKIINDIRCIAHNLKPATLDALGLTIATRQMVAEFSASSAIPVSTDIDLLDRITAPKANCACSASSRRRCSTSTNTPGRRGCGSRCAGSGEICASRSAITGRALRCPNRRRPTIPPGHGTFRPGTALPHDRRKAIHRQQTRQGDPPDHPPAVTCGRRDSWMNIQS